MTGVSRNAKPVTVDDLPMGVSKHLYDAELVLAEMISKLTRDAPASTTDALAILRKCYPNSALSLRIAAVSSITKQPAVRYDEKQSNAVSGIS
jgi:hypothetical protein